MCLTLRHISAFEICRMIRKSENKNGCVDFLYGNERIKLELLSEIKSGIMPHAYIIEGPDGSGKNTLARLITCALACEGDNPPCGECAVCLKISQGICADVFYTDVEKDRKFITVVQIRELRRNAFIKPNDCDVKVFIIKSAHSLNTQTQNMLLKLLEEPPSEVYFLLLCENSSNLLPTVKSRAPILKMQIFNEGQLDSYLCENDKKAVEKKKNSPDVYKYILKSAFGTIGRAKELLGRAGEKESARYAEISELISIICGKNKCGRAELLMFAQTIGATRDEVCEFLSGFSEALRDLIVSKKGTEDSPLIFFTEYEKAKKYAYSLPAGSILEMAKHAEYIRELLNEANVNLTLSKNMFAEGVFDAL